MQSIQPCEAFSVVLDYLGRVFLEPPQESFINHIVSDHLYEEWPFSTAAGTETARGLDMLQTLCRQWRPDMLDSLGQEYTQLFIGLERTLAPPYESVYLSRDHIMFERQTLEIREFYRREGLEIPNLHQEPDDHIGYELMFAAFLCSRQPSSYRDTLKQFLINHPLKWADMFCRRVWDNASGDYFRGHALLTRGTLLQLAQWVGIEQPWHNDGYNLV